MTVSLLPSLVPSLALPARSDLPRPAVPGLGRPLPMARLVSARKRSTVYGLTTIDARGRVADRVVTAALGWQPGNRLTLRVTGQLIIVTAVADGLVAVSGQGRVHLPAASRHACGIRPDDRVLLAAEPAEGVLVVHPLAALDAMVTGILDHAIGGDAA